MPSQSVLVIGGGLAGLSSAVALAEAGFRVELLEKRPHLGGRAASYLLPDGSHIDNCQHVTLGCCTNLDYFYRRAGVADRIRFYSRLYFLDRDRRPSTICSSLLPAPFHLAPSFLFFSGLERGDKRAIARAMLEIVRAGGEPADARGVTMREWLERRGQTRGAIELFWRTVLVSALDEELDRAEARYGIDVFWKAFLSNRRGFRLGIPTVPLGELYGGCQQALERAGGRIRTRARIREIRFADGRVAGVRLDDGGELSADFYLAAVPHDALLELLPGELVEREPAFAGLRELRVSPITGVHFWFDSVVLGQPFLALLGMTVQWIFNKSALWVRVGEAGGGEAQAGQYLQLVISASYGLVERSRQEIIELCLGELKEVLPRSREARLLKATVVKETAATFSPAPGVDRWRPGQRTPVSNLFLAGDWTRTGWPATMEGAVRGGYLAAEEILRAAGRPQRLLQPDLPIEGLARFCPRR
jgi:squalene-associated FAD-dependent desaturase